MGQISSIYDSVKSLVTTTLPTYKELSNPYFPETESDLTLTTGYGIAVGPGAYPEQDPRIGQVQLERDFIISLTQRIFRTRTDTSTRITAEKSIIGDLESIIEVIGQDKHLGDPAVIQSANALSDDGIEFVRVNRNDILIVRILVQVQYHTKVLLCT